MSPKAKQEFMTFAGQRIKATQKIVKLVRDRHNPTRAMQEMATHELKVEQAYEMVMLDLKTGRKT